MCSLLLAGCFFDKESKPQMKEIKGEIFGSYFIVKFHGPLEKMVFEKKLQIFFENFNQEFSTYDSNSVISRLNRLPQNEKIKVSARFIDMLELAHKFYRDTQGAFDPTLAPLIRAWGFGGGGYKKTPTPQELEAAKKRTGFERLKWDRNLLVVWKTNDLMLDINAFAPGWAADLIGKMLQEYGIYHYMVDISGEILFKGTKIGGESWIAGIETPSKNLGEKVQIAFKIKDLALATSGNYRQFFSEAGEIKGHILDPRTGGPVKHQISSASVLAASAAEADVWSTALMVLGKEGLDLAEKHGIKVLLLEAKKPQEFTEIISSGMKTYLEENRP